VTPVDKLKLMINDAHTNDELVPFLLEHSELFIDVDVIHYVRQKSIRLGRALMNMKPVPETSTTGRVGLVFALIMYGAEYLKLLPRYYRTLNASMRNDFNQKLEC
jgi:hypothetical protein